MMCRRLPSFRNARNPWCCGFLLAGLLANTAVNGVAASFALTGSLATARYGHTATLLLNGEVLVTGGLDASGNLLSSAELYNPNTGKWTVTGSMSEARSAFSATLLSSGEVLVVGGLASAASVSSSAELYNPSTGQWTSTGSMMQSRYAFSATLLPNGEVLVTGGASPTAGTLASAEVYNPSTRVWKTTGSLHISRAQATALLENGEVLTVGGYNFSNGIETQLASAEVYNPSTGLWSVIAGLARGISSPAGVLLADHDVLIANEAQFYKPVTAAWVNTGLLPKTAANPIRATLLNDGNVLASGTVCLNGGCRHLPSSICFLYTAASNSWSVTGSMNQARIGHSSTLLPNGKVLVVGGYSRAHGGPVSVLASAELYTP